MLREDFSSIVQHNRVCLVGISSNMHKRESDRSFPLLHFLHPGTLDGQRAHHVHLRSFSKTGAYLKQQLTAETELCNRIIVKLRF